MKGEKKPFDSDKIISIAILVLVCILAVMAATIIGIIIASAIHSFRVSSPPTDEPAEGVARVPAVARYLDGAEEADYFSLEEYREGDGPAPEWYRPDEPMSAEWEASGQQIAESVSDNGFASFEQVSASFEQVKDIGCPDWNLCSTLYGWDGHTAEPWELDLLARVFYLEFWGTSLPCSEAGCDAILNLWASGNYGQTLFEALSYYDPDYGYTYRVYPKVWQTDYDADGLAWCRAFCEKRFYNGPEWSAVYFQLGGYHDTDWVPPLYEMDGVYFSGKGQ